MNDSEKREIALTANKAQVYAIIITLPILILIFVIYYLLWDQNISGIQFARAVPTALWIGILILVGIVVHELLHGLTWGLFAKRGFKSIKFGVIWTALTPYCHCTDPLKLKHYLLGGLMPGLVLGLIPSFISIFSGNLSYLLFGLFFTLAAGGDFLIIWMLRKENKDSYVLDHPDKIGCFIIGKQG
jgi:hypothetical protein